ncbi:MAG: DUF4124 domain-containing protein [Proteobacteria bacterium]|nr:DUF4124 domain-containing protein [Pseudomonadota bacterium]
MSPDRAIGLVARKCVVYAEPMNRLSISSILAIVCLQSFAADIYRWKDDHGNIIFSDTPQAGAEQIEVGEIMTVPAERITHSISDLNEEPKAAKYDSVLITSPSNEQSFRDNGTFNVDVAVSITPPLQVRFGHQVQLLVDGNSHADPGRQTRFTLNDVERGEHQLQAVIVGSDGQVIERSPVSIFFLQKQSVLNRAP